MELQVRGIGREARSVALAGVCPPDVDLVAVDGPDGVHVLDEEAGVLLPASATMLYRVFSTVLRPEML